MNLFPGVPVEDCAYFAAVRSDILLGRLAIKSVVDLTAGKNVENRYLGRPVPAAVLGMSGAVRTLPADFAPARYLELNPYVRAVGTDPATHYLQHGIQERRRYK